MKHGPATPGANDPKITGTGVVTAGQEKRSYGKSKQKKDHLFLSFTFVTIVSLSFWQKAPALSIPFEQPARS